ncbi:Hydrolase (HAD superfamily) [Labilithrix luteola]|uniref:Hydrolase (HAD superfamily) n=1 Tax=Labilithrix luteola TaxID=1391654 RepID=A0A0K1PV42_9BACT|nr:HAD family hydrolase [Labilithrix luteola]AKU97226.1 Hydrolase (HAD superfamily) [Labilithrix luteola]
MTTKRSKANSAAATAVSAVAVSGKGSISKSSVSKARVAKASASEHSKARDSKDRVAKSSLLGGRKRKSAEGPYKLLAIDLDGTFLDHEGEAHEEDILAIKKLKARGIMVTILTGRLYSGTKESAEILGIDGPVGCADGSHIVRVAGQKTLFHRGIRGRAANKLRESLERNDLVAFLFAEDAIVHDERGADYLPFVRTWSTDLRYAHRITEHALWDSKDGMTAVVALGHETSVGRTVADIQRDTTESMQVAMFPFRRDAEHWGMVARASGGTKATALEWIAKHYGVSVDETVCVGDWMNDLPMLGAAGRSFAMGQAPDEVKKAATDVLERTITTGGGIAEAIARAFGR